MPGKLTASEVFWNLTNTVPYPFFSHEYAQPHLFDEQLLRKTSLIFNPFFRAFSWSPPLIHNPWWDGVRENEIEIQTILKIRHGNTAHKACHFQQGYVHPDAWPFVQHLIYYICAYAVREYESIFGKIGTYIKAFKCELGRGKYVMELSPHFQKASTSVFLHQPGLEPPILSYNWPPKSVYRPAS